ncbi:MAG TPA: hypothetical protein VGO62_22265, partial [Myxococcota bacterium]
MRALIVGTGRINTPFQEEPGLALYGDTTMGAAVRSFLVRRGFTVDTVDAGAPIAASNEATVVLADHTFVSDKCLGDFLKKAVDVVSAPARLALARTPSVDFTTPVSSIAIEPFDASGVGAKPAKGWAVELNASERAAYDCFFVDALPAAASGAALLDDLRARSLRVVVEKRELGIPLRLPILGDTKE